MTGGARVTQPAHGIELPEFLDSLGLARRAAALAAGVLAGQTRDWDGAPKVLHSLEVAALLHNTGWPEHVVAAGAVHDVLEDTDLPVDEIAAQLGEQVAELVLAVSEDETIEDYGERKAALRHQAAAAGIEALGIFAADKVSKVRELRAQIACRRMGEPGSAERRRAHYEASLALLREHAAEMPLVRQLGFELWALRRLPPAAERAD
jgi:(p)ppGpp synthase/HD superfamily hydrolase